MAEMPWETTGMVVLQAESEVAAINMVYGGAGTGKRVMTSSSSPGVSLKQEGISYIAGAELPCLIVNVMRGGPGLGTSPAQPGRLFPDRQRRRTWRLPPDHARSLFRTGMADFVGLGFELAFKYSNPAIILADGIIGQMMEKVVLPPFHTRRTEEEIIAECHGPHRERQPAVNRMSLLHWSWTRQRWRKTTSASKLNIGRSKKMKSATKSSSAKMPNIC